MENLEKRVSIKLPLSIPMPTKKNPKAKFYLNKNSEGNANRYVYDKAKQKLKDIVLCELGDNRDPIDEPVIIITSIYKKNKTLCDVGNYLIVEKFATDAIVDFGLLKDDNFNYVKGVFGVWGGFSNESYCLFEVYSLKFA